MTKRTKKYCVIKRRGHEEKFDERKIYASCYAACLSTRMKEEKAEKICEKIAKKIKNWAKGKARISSDEIFKKASVLLKKYDEDAAFMYRTHRDVS